MDHRPAQQLSERSLNYKKDVKMESTVRTEAFEDQYSEFKSHREQNF